MVLVDGNNLLHAYRTQVIGPAVGRHRLVQLIAQWAKHKNETTIVFFDGPRPAASFDRQLRLEGLELVFSGAEAADALILRRLAAIRGGPAVQVVSTDREIRFAAHAVGAREILSEAFVDDLLVASRERSKASGGDAARALELDPPPLGVPTAEADLKASKEEGIGSTEAQRWMDEMLGEDQDFLPPDWQI